MIKKRNVGIIFCIAVIIFVFLYIHFSNLHESFGSYDFLDLQFPIVGTTSSQTATSMSLSRRPTARVTIDATSSETTTDEAVISQRISEEAAPYPEARTIDTRPLWYDFTNSNNCQDSSKIWYYEAYNCRNTCRGKRVWSWTKMKNVWNDCYWGNRNECDYRGIRYPKCNTTNCGRDYVNIGNYDAITGTSTGPGGAKTYRCTNPNAPWQTINSCPSGYQLKNGYEGTGAEKRAWTKGCKRID